MVPLGIAFIYTWEEYRGPFVSYERNIRGLGLCNLWRVKKTYLAYNHRKNIPANTAPAAKFSASFLTKHGYLLTSDSCVFMKWASSRVSWGPALAVCHVLKSAH